MITITLEGVDNIQRKLANAPPAIKRKVLAKVSKEVIKLDKERTRQQVDVEGSAYKPHAKGRRRKMLTRLITNLSVVWSSEAEAVIGFKNSLHGMIGARQQFGFVQNFRAGDMQLDGSRTTQAFYKQPATRKQAKALLAAGYKLRLPGKVTRTPTQKWITENLTVGRAGFIMRLLKAAQTQWQTVLPARSFLGVSAADLIRLTDAALAEAEAALDTGHA